MEAHIKIVDAKYQQKVWEMYGFSSKSCDVQSRN